MNFVDNSLARDLTLRLAGDIEGFAWVRVDDGNQRLCVRLGSTGVVIFSGPPYTADSIGAWSVIDHR